MPKRSFMTENIINYGDPNTNSPLSVTFPAEYKDYSTEVLIGMYKSGDEYAFNAILVKEVIKKTLVSYAYRLSNSIWCTCEKYDLLTAGMMAVAEYALRWDKDYIPEAEDKNYASERYGKNDPEAYLAWNIITAMKNEVRCWQGSENKKREDEEDEETL